MSRRAGSAMLTVSADCILAAWDIARSAPEGQRAEAIMRAFGVAEQTSLGARDAALLRLFEDRFGPRLDGVSRCPDCGTDVELGVDVGDLTASMASADPVAPLAIGGERIEWRLPDGADLAAAAAARDVDEGARMLLSRCLTGISKERRLPDGLREMLAERIGAADPYTDLTLSLVCPACAGTWDSALDIAEFIWATLQSRARRLLHEVDELARRYGWSETHILALSQARRDSYLELVRDG